jgi:hypothetical protein
VSVKESQRERARERAREREGERERERESEKVRERTRASERASERERERERDHPELGSFLCSPILLDERTEPDDVRGCTWVVLPFVKYECTEMSCMRAQQVFHVCVHKCACTVMSCMHAQICVHRYVNLCAPPMWHVRAHPRDTCVHTYIYDIQTCIWCKMMVPSSPKDVGVECSTQSSHKDVRVQCSTCWRRVQHVGLAM